MNEIVIVQPDKREHAAVGSGMLARAQAFEVVDATSQAAGDSMLVEIAKCVRTIESVFAAPKKAAHDAHKSIVATEKALLRPLDDARAVLSRKLTEYREEARRKAEVERKRIESELRKAEEARIIAAAVDAEEQGHDDVAAEILDAPVVSPPILVEPEIVQTKGVTATTRWRAEVVDVLALVRYVATHPNMIHLVEASLPALNTMARAMRDGLNIPGVRAVAEQGLAVRAG